MSSALHWRELAVPLLFNLNACHVTECVTEFNNSVFSPGLMIRGDTRNAAKQTGLQADLQAARPPLGVESGRTRLKSGQEQVQCASTKHQFSAHGGGSSPEDEPLGGIGVAAICGHCTQCPPSPAVKLGGF